MQSFASLRVVQPSNSSGHAAYHASQALGERGLRPLMGVLLCCLVDPRLTIMGEGMALLKALNLLMMKILENCDRCVLAACSPANVFGDA